MTWDEVNNPLYHESFGLALSLNRRQDVESKGSLEDSSYRAVDSENKSDGHSGVPLVQVSNPGSKFRTTRPGRSPADISKEKEEEVYNILHKYSKLNQPDHEITLKAVEGKASPGIVTNL